MAARDWLHLDAAFDEQEFRRLWLVAVATYGVGDVVTTIALAQFSTALAEGNTALRAALDGFGQGGLVALKLGVLLACLAVSVDAARRGDRVLYYLPPALLAVVGAFTTAYNLRLLVG
jgi:hypothetical protein